MNTVLHNLSNRRHPCDDPRRKGSVLVLVMTLLSILFVIGVAFLATISFEQDIIQAERLRFQSQSGVDEVFHDFSGLLREGLMAGAEAPFGGESPETSITGFAQLPMWHNTTSPIEPYQRSIDGPVVFNWHTDVSAITNSPFDGPNLPVNSRFEIDTAWTNGDNIAVNVCQNGSNKGAPCVNDADCPGGTCQTRIVVVVDADGDGIVDTISADASTLNFSKSQLEQLSTTVNGRPDGKVSVGLRIIPHNGLVNLNESHPNLIQNVLGLDWWPLQGEPPDRKLDNFVHTPTQYNTAYNPYIEEPILRRRGGTLPPSKIPPSRLFGAAFADPNAAGDIIGDMQNQLLPGVNPDPASPRYWMYKPDETITNKLGDPLLWAMRMEPFYSTINNTGADPFSEYDRSHLVTTISYDDLLSRGGSVPTPSGIKEIDQAMREANHTEFAGENDPTCLNLLPFEYANYPHTMDNDHGCCATDITCKLKRLKGRLQLSLSWLDELFDADTIAQNSGVADIRNRLIYDAFWMLVQNASGYYWDGQYDNNCSIDSQCGPGPFVCQLPVGATSGGACIDSSTRQPRREALISRTAASLAANLVDYVDADDIPTRIAVRAFDFTDLDSAGDDVPVGIGVCRDGIDAGLSCRRHSECRGSFCDITSTCIAGPSIGTSCRIDRDCGTPGGICNLKRYVYGLERQPFISEVAINSDGVTINSRGIDIFNPYDDPIEGEYWIYEVDPSNTTNPIQHRYKIINTIEPKNIANTGPFTAFVSGSFAGGAGANGTIYKLGATDALQFDNNWIVYLVRKVEYTPGVKTDIIVDQTHTDFTLVAPGGITTVMQRVVPDPGAATSSPSDIWKVTVPIVPAISGPGERLGRWKLMNDNATHPVELNPSNAGLYAQLNNDPITLAPIPVAFPTTGSMLMLLRHANRSWNDYKLPAAIGSTGKTTETELAFTTWLDDETTIKDLSTGATIATIKESELIDNGRMPIFDRPFLNTTTNKRYAAHHEMHDNNDLNKPGGVENLPWGQLVFDYFTTLSLNHRGPYHTYNDNQSVGMPQARPRVDMDGLRVHGRIDINAAPMLVLQGLPYIPMERIPQAYQARIASALIITDPAIAEIAHGELATSIVAYREAREGNPTAGGVVTGDYGLSDTNGRAWMDNSPAFRRGTGFLTVGELANIRIETGRSCVGGASPGIACINDTICGNGTCQANNAPFRVDRGLVNPNVPADDADFVEAVALLASLGDWVTVRSDVYTMYGVIRGEIDPSIDSDAANQPTQRQLEDLEARSVRFQHTVDRLMTFFGESAPVGIGDRIMGKYRDINNN